MKGSNMAGNMNFPKNSTREPERGEKPTREGPKSIEMANAIRHLESHHVGHEDHMRAHPEHHKRHRK